MDNDNKQLYQSYNKQMKSYFRGLMQDIDNSTLKSSLIDLLDSRKRIVRQIRAGRVEVNQQQSDIDTILLANKNKQQNQAKSVRLQLLKQIQNLNRNDFQSDQAFKRAKNELILQRQQQIQQQKEKQQQRKRQIQQKVKKWSLQQKQLFKKKNQKLQEEQKLKQMQQVQERIKNEKEKAAASIEKRKRIEQKIKSIELNKNKRESEFKELMIRQKSMEKPLYVKINDRLQKMQQDRVFEEIVEKKQKRIAMRMDYEQLKNHQRMFLTKIQERSKKIQESRARASSSMPDSQFNVFTNRSQEKVKDQLEKKNRRWKYQQKIKQIPIQIDEAKKVKIQIALDKAKNPFKYNFLSQKSLNEFQIYGEFKNFSINSNPRQIGKNYLEQLKKIPKQSRIQKSSSLQLIKESSISDRPQYRNYLAELKSKKGQPNQQQKDEIKKILAKSKNKDEAYKSLQKKTDELDSNLEQKMKQLKNLDSRNIKNVLKKQSQIDEIYAKALKARLARLQITK